MAHVQPQPSRASTIGYSSQVRLDLFVNGGQIPLAQIGHDHVILDVPAAIPAGAAEVVMHVDDVPRRWSVEVLPHEPGSLRIPIRRAG